MAPSSALWTVMTGAARKAARAMKRDFGEVEQLQVSRKGPADFVSMADKRAEQTIVEELRNARPDWGMLLEEGGEIEGNPAKPRWIVQQTTFFDLVMIYVSNLQDEVKIEWIDIVK